MTHIESIRSQIESTQNENKQTQKEYTRSRPSTHGADMDGAKDALSALFPGQLRKKLLIRTFLEEQESFHVSGLARLLDVSRGALSRELTDLTQAGILRQSRRGNLVLYQANREAPFFTELRGLIRKTAGAVPALRDAVQPFAGKLDFAFVFGSVAKGVDQPDSDIDLLLIGEHITGRMKAELRVALKEFGRDLDIQDMTLNQYRELLQHESPFILEVISGPVIMLVGEEDELKNSGRVREGARRQAGGT
jgi:predicted nucleotidyltransferase